MIQARRLLTSLSSLSLHQQQLIKAPTTVFSGCRGYRRVTRENSAPYNLPIERVTERSRHPLNWDFPDSQRRPAPDETDPNLPELDILYRSIDVETRAHDDAVLSSYEKFLLMTAEHLELNVGYVFKWVEWIL